MSRRIMHMRVDVRGLLHRNDRDLKKHTKWMLRPDGTRYTVGALRDALMDELSEGREYLPVGDCEGFDFKNGCPGHPVADDAEATP